LLPESKCDKYRWIVRVQRGHVYIQSEALKAPMDAKNMKTEKTCFCIVTKVDPFEKNKGFCKILANTGSEEASKYRCD